MSSPTTIAEQIAQIDEAIADATREAKAAALLHENALAFDESAVQRTHVTYALCESASAKLEAQRRGLQRRLFLEQRETLNLSLRQAADELRELDAQYTEATARFKRAEAEYAEADRALFQAKNARDQAWSRRDARARKRAEFLATNAAALELAESFAGAVMA